VRSTNETKFSASNGKAGTPFSKMAGHFDGGLLPELPPLFDVLGGDSWTAYRFLIQHHLELDSDTALSALQRGKVSQVLVPTESVAGVFS
jgi:hypothetical protein